MSSDDLVDRVLVRRIRHRPAERPRMIGARQFPLEFKLDVVRRLHAGARLCDLAAEFDVAEAVIARWGRGERLGQAGSARGNSYSDIRDREQAREASRRIRADLAERARAVAHDAVGGCDPRRAGE